MRRLHECHMDMELHECHDNSVGVTTVCGSRIRLHMKSVTGMDSLASPCRSGSADARVYKPLYAGRARMARLTERAEEAEEAAPHAWLPAGALPARAVPSVRGGRAEEDGAHDSCFLPGHARSPRERQAAARASRTATRVVCYFALVRWIHPQSSCNRVDRKLTSYYWRLGFKFQLKLKAKVAADGYYVLHQRPRAPSSVSQSRRFQRFGELCTGSS